MATKVPEIETGRGRPVRAQEGTTSSVVLTTRQRPAKAECYYGSNSKAVQENNPWNVSIVLILVQVFYGTSQEELSLSEGADGSEKNSDTMSDAASERPEDSQEVDASIGAFTSALIFNTAIGVGIFVAFCIVRYWNKKIYQPRTYLVKEDIRSPELPTGIFTWITASFKVKDDDLVNRIGLDAYMFLRFQRMSATLFAGFTLLAIPILLPLNIVNGLNVQEGLPRMTIGNVKDSWRLWFHLFLTIIFCAVTVRMLWREMQEYTRRRHAYLMSEKHAMTPQSTTILVTAIPKSLKTEKALYNIFNRFPGGVRSIWINKNPEKLIKLCKERDEVVLKLETAEYNYIRSAYGKQSSKDPEIKEPVRPIGRTSAIPFVGPKVDLIEFYTNRLSELNQEITKAQQAGTSATLNSAFIQFNNQFAAHSAVQTVVHPSPFKMMPLVEISPLDVVWDHMNLDTAVRKGRTFVSLTAATALALLWSFPVIFVSGIANIAALVKMLPFLSFLNDLPESILGIIQGILPPLFLAILMALLPIVLTMMATFEGHVRHSSITLSVMSKYFVFLIVNVLLLSALSGGFINTIQDMQKKNFSVIEVFNLIGLNLPKSSTFFVTYSLLQGFTGPVKELLQIAPLVLNFLFTKLLAKSPRQVWNVQGRLSSVNYGVIFPPQILMFSIGMVYSTISPLVLPFVAFFFFMFYFVYRHQFLYVYQQPVETGGLAFPLAVKQAYTGIFIFELTVFAIFLLKQSTLNVIPHLVLLFFLIAGTALSLSNMNEAFDPLVTYLPVALFSKDLKIQENGVVSEGERNSTDAPNNIMHEEAALGEKGSMIAMNHLSRDDQRSDIAFLPVGKQEYDEAGTVSSQLPAFPTPHPSDADSVSFSYQSQYPSTARAAATGTAPSVSDSPTQTAQDAELRRLQQEAYSHPALYNQQTPIWLPMDARGLVVEEISKLSNRGIVVATTGADIDPTTAKTHVGGIVYAPGEEVRYRLERGI
ncbi:hypothetical protein BGZ51_003740 [Haplosporangium sp. Z 767]|nr:hypothetical protein BGZ50_008457 [Haplosporangium sp. Z 11]KAF9183830.1 hypothetical protein BGZ51_003740 [Haplosporangium sp. Z 767]